MKSDWAVRGILAAKCREGQGRCERGAAWSAAAIAAAVPGSGRIVNHLRFRFHGISDVLGIRQGPTDVRILRAQFESDKPVAMLAVGLKSVTNPLRPLPKHLRAFAAPDSHLVVDHGTPLNRHIGIQKFQFG
jgi:hypothetical protein